MTTTIGGVVRSASPGPQLLGQAHRPVALLADGGRADEHAVGDGAEAHEQRSRSVRLDSEPTRPCQASEPSRPATMLASSHGRPVGAGRSAS